MSQQLSYPSDRFPGMPSISLGAPEGWEPLTVPGVQMALARPLVEGIFRDNLVVTVQRFAPGFGPEQVAEGLAARKAELPGLQERGGREIVGIDGRTWAESEYAYTHPGRPRVVQLARCTVIARGDVAVDVVELVGSCGDGGGEDTIAVLRTIQDSVRVRIP